MHVLLTRKFIVSGTDDLETHLDEVMDHLLNLEGDVLSDSDVSAVLTTGEIAISIVGSSQLEDISEASDEAIASADSAIRSAIHAAGGATPEWTVVPVGTFSEALLAA